MNLKVRRLTAMLLIFAMSFVVACNGTDKANDKKSLESSSDAPTIEGEETGLTLEINKSEVLGESFDISLEEPVDEYYSDKVVSYISPYVPIYADTNPDNKDENKIGVMLPKSIADIINISGEYTKIKSGNVEGFIKNESVLFGKEARF